MTTHRWTLTDCQDWDAATADQGGTGELGFRRRRLAGGLSDGLEILELACGDLKFTVLPTRGMSIWRATVGDVELGWRSPILGPVNSKFVPLAEPSGLGWLDGFDEFFVRCGLVSNGAPEFDEAGRLKFGLHGRIAHRPAHFVEVTLDSETGTLEVQGAVREARFHFGSLELTTLYECKLGRPSILVHDEIRNCGSQPTGMEILYHVNFGPPMLESGSRVIAPVREIAARNVHAANGIESWDLFSAPELGFQEQVYFMELFEDRDHHTGAMLCNADKSRAAFIKFSREQLPCFSLWKDTGGIEDGYVTGLEPATNFPNIRSFEEKRGRVVTLEPGARYPIQLEIGVCANSATVERHEQEIRKLQASPAHIINWLSADYSPEGESDLT